MHATHDALRAGRERDDKKARERRAEEERGVLYTLERRVGAFDPHPRPPGEVGDEALSGRVPRRVEETAKEDKHQQLPEKQPDRVIAVLEPLLKYKHDYPLYHLLGEAHYQKEQLDKARHYFEEAIKLNGQSALDHYQLGNIYLAQKRFAKAAQAYERAGQLLVQAPASAQLNQYLGALLFNRSWARRQMGDQGWTQDLQSDVSSQPRVVCAVDDAHAAPADQLPDPIAVELSPDPDLERIVHAHLTGPRRAW